MKSKGAKNSKSKKTGVGRASGTKKSLPCHKGSGIPVQPSGQDVAVRSIPVEVLPSNQITVDLKPDKETVKALFSICMGVLGETLSSTSMELGLMNASNIAVSMGVSEEKFQEVAQASIEAWAKMRSRNPIAGMMP